MKKINWRTVLVFIFMVIVCLGVFNATVHVFNLARSSTKWGSDELLNWFALFSISVFVYLGLDNLITDIYKTYYAENKQDISDYAVAIQTKVVQLIEVCDEEIKSLLSLMDDDNELPEGTYNELEAELDVYRSTKQSLEEILLPEKQK